ncbi:cell wall hydrolase, partial [Burkholderia cepacia]|uniref:cell wall hydrolase n=1 Tax=Burkholderia cepacia TaxID=292 RepID=UPI0011CFADC1
RLMHHEIIVGPELRAFLEKSRAAAAKATPQQKTLLRVVPDAQLHNPVLAPPQAGLLPVNTIVALDGTPPDDALYVKVKSTGGMQWIDRKAKLPTGAKEANLFRLNDGAVYTAADIVRVPRQGTVGQPGATRFRGVFVGAASQTPVWITKDAYTALVSVQGGKLLTADLAQGWESFPLTFAANGPKNGAQPQHVSRLMLQQSRPDKQIPTELLKVFALDEAGNAWWQVQLKTGGTTAIGWVGEVGHAGVSLHSPHEWVDFKLIESKPTTAAYGSYFADFKQMEEFQRGRLGLKDADLDVPLREVRALLDANHDGQLTLAEVKAAQRDRDTIYQLSRVILRYPSEWKADKKAWDAYDALIPPSSKMVWESEKTRIVQLVWWENVAGKAKDFPVDSSVFHIHPVSLVEIFNWPDFDEWMYMARTLYGEARGQNFESKVAVAWIIRNRLERGTWGDTYKDVVTARLQFTCWSERIDPDGYKAIHNPQGDPWKDCKKAALKVMLARDEENVFPGATHYYSPRAQAQLHAKNPTLYPNTPLFAVPEKRVKNPEGVSDEDYQFYRM